MSLSLVGSAINTLLVDLLSQRRHQAARPDEGGTLLAQSDAAGNPTTGGSASGQPAPADIAGATAASWPSSSAYLQSAMNTDLSIARIALPSDPVGYGASGPPSQMASGTVAPAISSTSLLEDLTSLLSSAMSGDAGGAESAAAALQADIETASGVGANGATAAAPNSTHAAPQSGPAPRIDVVQSTDTIAAKPAAAGPTKNTPAAVGGHHRSARRTSAQPTTAAAASGANGASQPTAPETGSESALLAAARQAYELLMRFASASGE
jgi:hypothetical protein